MDCLVNLALACLFQVENVYVSLDAFYSPYRYHESAAGRTEGPWCERGFCDGPQGTLRIGMEAPLPNNFTLRYGLQHQSYFVEKDRGFEGAFLQLEWKPFAK
jgi:hypothetical protein